MHRRGGMKGEAAVKARGQAVFIIEKSIGLEIVISTARRFSFGRHSHVSTFVVGLIRRGRLRLCCGSESTLYSTGDIYIIAPHQPHSIRSLPTCTMINVCIDAALPSSQAWRQKLASASRTLNSLAEQGMLLQDEPSRIEKALQSIRPFPARPLDALEQFRLFLETSPEQEIRLGTMAQSLHLDPFHCIRIFKKRYGMTPHAYLLQSRVRKAKQTCLNPASLTAAALASGFYDQSHCIRLFKKSLGLTPRQYRSAVRLREGST